MEWSKELAYWAGNLTVSPAELPSNMCPTTCSALTADQGCLLYCYLTIFLKTLILLHHCINTLWKLKYSYLVIQWKLNKISEMLLCFPLDAIFSQFGSFSGRKIARTGVKLNQQCWFSTRWPNYEIQTQRRPPYNVHCTESHCFVTHTLKLFREAE